MVDAVKESAQWASIPVGFIFLWLGIFARVDEQHRLESLLTEWWVCVELLREQGNSRLTAFLLTMYQKTDSMLKAIFGVHLFSARAIGASIALSLGGATLVVLSAMLLQIAVTRSLHDLGLVAVFLGATIWLFAVGLLQLYQPKWWRIQLVLALASSAVYVYAFASMLDSLESLSRIGDSLGRPRRPVFMELLQDSSINAAVGMVLSFMSDIVFITITRAAIQWASSTRTSGVPIVIGIVNVSLASAFVGMPLIASQRMMAGVKLTWHLLVIQLALFNVADVMVAMIFFIVAALALIHRALWPLLSRLLEVAQAEHILSHRKVLITFGVALVSFGAPHVGAFLVAILGLH